MKEIKLEVSEALMDEILECDDVQLMLTVHDSEKKIAVRPIKPKPIGRIQVQFQPSREVFDMSGTILDVNVALVCQELIANRWIASETKPDDFLKLFKNEDSDVKIVWMRVVGIGSLKRLFEMMIDCGFINQPKGSVNKILRSHFILVGTVDTPIGDLRGASYTTKSDHVITKCKGLLETKLCAIRDWRNDKC